MITPNNSCRSTISQQEAELKRLKETLEIRTKRIIQLEQIVGYASDHISSRGTQNSHDSNYDVLANKLDEVINIGSRLCIRYKI